MRPMSLDLLWAILERGKAISNREWRLSHVAIVDMRNSTYIGRIFFGDSETGEVVWDADCRPSDACWLALKVSSYTDDLQGQKIIQYEAHWL